MTGWPEAAGRDVADHAGPADAVRAASPGQEVIMRGALTARNRTAGRKMMLSAGSRSARPGGHMALSERAGRAGVVLSGVEQCRLRS